jgi:hypothetical protein
MGKVAVAEVPAGTEGLDELYELDAHESEPQGMPAEDKPAGMPAEDKPAGMPAEDKPEGMPAEDKPEGMPAEDKPEGMPAELSGRRDACGCGTLASARAAFVGYTSTRNRTLS